MKRTILHLLISLFLVQFLVAYNLTALELPGSRDRSAEISTFQLLDLNCDFAESSGKSDGFAWDRPFYCSGSREYSENISAHAAFLDSPSVHRPFLSSYKDISHLRL